MEKLRKWDVLPKVEGVKAIPTDEKSKRHILYQTTSQAYGQVSFTIFVFRIVVFFLFDLFQVKYFIQITPTKFELPVQRHPLHQTISKYQGSGEYLTSFKTLKFFNSYDIDKLNIFSALGHRSGMLNNSKSPNPLGEDGMYTAAASRVKHQLYTNRS